MMILIYSTFPDEQTAARIGKALLDKKLICCSNIFPIRSQYVWEGKVVDDNESAAFFKTTIGKQHEAIESLTQLHPYDVPIIASRKTDINAGYLDWANEFLSS